ncbi:hypothetical protein DB345_10415 [Spartobacteria bacterium LR76]|nr:hypothetical protein DB345_10415 [Spartobacteria bacterium LR76]
MALAVVVWSASTVVAQDLTQKELAASEWIEGDFTQMAEVMGGALMKPSPYMSGWTYCKDWPLYVERDTTDADFDRFARKNVRDLQAAGINCVKWSTFPWTEDTDFKIFSQYDKLFRENGMKFFIQTDKVDDLDKMAEHLARLHQFTSSPAYLRIGGKPVLVNFAAHTLSDSDWKAVFDKLKQKGIDFYHVRSIPPEAGELPPFSPEFDRIMQQTMSVGWSGIQEFTPKTWEGHTRAEYIREMLRYCARNKWKFYPSVTHNLWRTEWGAYWNVRTLTAMFRNGLEDIMKSGSRSSHITTWNDFPEGQYIAPSMYKGEVMLALANYFSVIAAGNTYAGDAGAFLVQEPAVDLGQAARFELIAFPSSREKQRFVEGVILDDQDHIVHRIEKTQMPEKTLLVKEFAVSSVPRPGERTWFLRPFVWFFDEGETVPDFDFRTTASTARPVQIKAAANKNFVFNSTRIRHFSELAATSTLKVTDGSIEAEIVSHTPIVEARLMENDNQIVANPGISQNIPLRFEVLVQAVRTRQPHCAVSLSQGRITQALRDQPRWSEDIVREGLSISDAGDKVTWQTKSFNQSNGAERIVIETDASPAGSVTLTCGNVSRTVAVKDLLEQDVATFEFIPDLVAASIRVTARAAEMTLFERLPAPKKTISFRYDRPLVAQFGADMFFNEFETEDGVRYYGDPLVLFPKRTDASPAASSLRSVQVFDEKSHGLVESQVADSEATLVHLVEPRAEGSLVLPNTASFREPYNYGWPSIAGRWSVAYHWANKKDSEPRTENGASWFDGKDDFYMLTSRVVPSGPFEVSCDVFPEQTGGLQTILASPHIVAQIAPDGVVVVKLSSVTEGNNPVTADKVVFRSDKKITFDRWTSLKILISGTDVALFLDGQPAGSVAVEYPYRFFFREFPPLLGALRVSQWGNQTRDHFKGGIRNFCIGLYTDSPTSSASAAITTSQ